MSDTLIGVARPRVDAPDKVTGATRFAADGYVHGLLHARPVLSTEAHARIRRRRLGRHIGDSRCRGRAPRVGSPARDDRNRPHGRAPRAGGGRFRRPAGRARRRGDGGGCRGRRRAPVRGLRVTRRGRRRRGRDGAGRRARADRRGDGGGGRSRVHPRRRRPRAGGRPRRGSSRATCSIA